MISTLGLTHIHLQVRDLSRSAFFYERVFGMEGRIAPPGLVFLQTPGAQDLVALHQADADDETVGHSAGVAHFGFRLRRAHDFGDAIELVGVAGGRLVDRGEHGPGIEFALVADPDGYLIELASPYEVPPRDIG